MGPLIARGLASLLGRGAASEVAAGTRQLQVNAAKTAAQNAAKTTVPTANPQAVTTGTGAGPASVNTPPVPPVPPASSAKPVPPPLPPNNAAAGGAGNGPPPLPPNNGASGSPDDGKPKGPNPNNFTPQEKSQMANLVKLAADVKEEAGRAIKETIGKPFEQGAKALDKGRSVVNNDLVGFMEQVDMLPDGMKKFARSLDNLTNAIDERGRYLSKFNGNLALKGAEADVRKMRAEINEANYVGDSYGKVIEQKSKFETELMDFLNPFKEIVAEFVTDGLETLRGVLQFAKDYLQPTMIVIVELLRASLQAAMTNFDKAADIMSAIPEKIAKAQQKVNTDSDLLKKIFENSALADKSRIERKAPDVFAPGVIGVN